MLGDTLWCSPGQTETRLRLWGLALVLGLRLGLSLGLGIQRATQQASGANGNWLLKWRIYFFFLPQLTELTEERETEIDSAKCSFN